MSEFDFYLLYDRYPRISYGTPRIHYGTPNVTYDNLYFLLLLLGYTRLPHQPYPWILPQATLGVVVR